MADSAANENFEIFPWDRNFETGIAVIDQQHRRLVGILNDLAAHLANLSGAITLNAVLDQLADYADYHFKTEEEIWRNNFGQDRWFLEHQGTHDGFIAKVGSLRRVEQTQDYDDLIQDIVSFLAQWLAYHILDTDKRMAKVVLGLAGGLSLEAAKVRSTEEMSGSMQVLIETVLKMYDTLSSRTLDLMRERALRKQVEALLLASEERWKFVLEGGGENVWDWDIENGYESHSDDDNLVFDIVRNNLCSIRGESSIHPADADRLKADLQAHLDGHTEFYVNKHRVLRGNGGWSWVLTRGKVVSRDPAGHALRMVGTHTDITERELASLIYGYSAQAMFVSDVNNDIVSINPAFTQITGYTEQDVVGKNPAMLVAPVHDREFYRRIWRAIEATGAWQGEFWGQRKDGQVFYESLSVSAVCGEDGVPDHYVALFSDVTERKKAEETIVQQANFDSLTKLPNRRMFRELLDREIKKSHRTRTMLALLYVDLDHFKEVNDTLSHEIGDRLLVEAADRMVNRLRETDTVARIGGDEFTVIIPELHDITNVERLAQQLIVALGSPFQLGISQVHISASIGITLYPADADNVSDLLKNADQAMYLAKRSGRGRFSYFTPAMQDAALERQRLMDDLRRAQSCDQFSVYYQPVVDLASGTVVKAEALLRWHHPERGLVEPSQFIPLAEESGLIVNLGQWIHQQALQQTELWRKNFNPDFQVSVNRSPVQFRSSGDLKNTMDNLRQLGLPGHSSVIEITEGLLMENDSEVLEQLLKLHDAGVEVALDDFGTGYSSLSYLLEFDIDYIKIDKSFIQGLEEDSQQMVLCEAMVMMAHRLGIKVVAEGVETERHHHLLSGMQCDYAQGFFYSKPVPAAEFERFFHACY